MDRHHVGMDDGRRRLGFSSKAPPSRTARGEMWGEDLDGNDAIQGSIVTLEDNPHPARSDHAQNLIATETPQHLRIIGRGKPLEHAFRGMYREPIGRFLRLPWFARIPIDGQFREPMNIDRIIAEKLTGLMPRVGIGRRLLEFPATGFASIKVRFDT